jgi:ribokinase
MKVLVVGSLNMDLVVNLKRMPNPGETVLGETFSTFAGGKGLNQAVATSRAGAQVRMIGALGDDPYAKVLREVMDQEVSGSSGTAVIEVDESGQNRIVVIAGANGKLKSGNFVPESEEKILLAQLESPINELEEIFRAAKKSGYKTVLNPAPAMKLAPTFLAEIDLLIPNEHEAAILTGITVTDFESAEKAARALIAQGVAEVIITMAEKGAIYVSSDKVIKQPAYKVSPIDTTAAGDAFCGGLVSELARGKDMESALKFAAAAGGLATTKSGATPSLPTENEIRSLQKSQGE